MSEIHDALATLSDDERKAVLVRHYALFAAYYFDLTMDDFMDDMVTFTDKNQRSVILLPAGHTKALAPETPIPVPSGWTTMGELKIGDKVFDENGEVCHVINVLPWEKRRRYLVVDSDGCSIVADEHHDWKTRLNDWQDYQIVETKDMRCNRGRRVRIANCKPLQLPEVDLPIHPYVFGVWLGDGHSAGPRITTADDEVVENIRATGMPVTFQVDSGGKAKTYRLGNGDYSRDGVQSTLKRIGVLNDKHIPVFYRRASEKQRLSLLQGLMDSDGNVMKGGQCYFRSTNKRLALGVLELVRSLGRRATMSEYRAKLYDRDCGPQWAVTFYMKDCCRLTRKRERTREATKYYDHYVKTEEWNDGPSVCISVDSPTEMFLAGWNFTPTHNSTTFGKLDNIRHICWNPNIRIQLIMSVYDDAEEYCKSIEDELTSNELLLADFGPFYNPKAWKNDSFTVIGRQHNDPKPTMRIFGAGGKAPNWTLKGQGCDRLVCDDAVTEDTAGSPETRKRQHDWYFMAVQRNPRPMWPIDWKSNPTYGLKVPKGITWPHDAPYNPVRGSKTPYGQIVVPGTRFDPKDLYQDLIENDTYNVLHLDVWAEKVNGEWQTDPTETKPLWSFMWTNEALEAEREADLRAFNCRMRNDPMDASRITFERSWFDGDETHPGCYNDARSYGQIPWDETGTPLSLYIVTGFDPASGKNTVWAAFPTYIVLGFPNGGDVATDKRYVIDAWRGHIGPEWMLDILFDGNPAIPHPGFYSRYRYNKAVVEDNGFATLLTGHHRVSEARRRGIFVESTTTGRNKLDPVMGVKSMTQIFRDGLVEFPTRDASDKEMTKTIVDQFCYFQFDRAGKRKSLTDFPMAFWFCETDIRKLGEQGKRVYRHKTSPYSIRNPYYDTVRR